MTNNSEHSIEAPFVSIASNGIEIALKAIKDCQAQHSTASCIFCREMADCTKKNEFEQKTQANLEQKRDSLRFCQKNKGFSSCLNCIELLECAIRNEYVGAVYLSMNKGNGGSFEF